MYYKFNKHRTSHYLPKLLKYSFLNGFQKLPSVVSPSLPSELIHFMSLFYYLLHYVATGIISGFHWGLGVGTGITASGVIISHVGIPKTYFIYSVMTVAVLALILLTHGLIRLGKRKENAGEAS